MLSTLGAPPDSGVAVVRRGQTTSDIAKAHGVTVSALVAANPKKTIMRTSKGGPAKWVFAEMRVGERLALPAPTSAFLGNPCNASDADYDQWECVKAQVDTRDAQDNLAVVGVVVSVAGLAIALGTKFVEIMDEKFPDDTKSALECLGKGWAWDVEGRFCADPATPIGRRAYCKMIEGTKLTGDTCECTDAGLEWDGKGCVPRRPVVEIEPTPTDGPPRYEIVPVGLSTTTKVLLAVGAVAAVGATAVGGMYLAKRKR